MENEIPNANGVETVNNSNVVETAPVWTSQSPQRETAEPTPAAAEETTVVEEGATTTQTETETEPSPAEPAQPAKPVYTAEQIQQLSVAANYQPEEVTIDFVDELGNFDPQKFGEFMAKNNETIVNKTLAAAQARTQLSQMEDSAWASIEQDFPEISGNETLTKALRGARIQDLLAGGDGDLSKLATDIVGPIRENRIKAVEEVNRTVTEQKKLETFTPENQGAEHAEPPLMVQLSTAISRGDTEAANRIRHAIRKERINANN